MNGVRKLGNIVTSVKRSLFKGLTSNEKKSFNKASKDMLDFLEFDRKNTGGDDQLSNAEQRAIKRKNIKSIEKRDHNGPEIKEKGKEMLAFLEFDEQNTGDNKEDTKTRKKQKKHMRPTNSTQWGIGDYDKSKKKGPKKSNQPVTKKKEPRKTIKEKARGWGKFFWDFMKFDNM